MQSIGGYRGTIFVAFAAALLLAGPAASAGAEGEVTRAEYKAAVEPICKSNTKANDRILKGVRGKVQRGKLKAASRQFARASRALKKTLRQLRAVEQPVADVRTLGKWLRYVKLQADLLRKVAQKLSAGNRVATQSLVARLTRNANLANNTVFAFSFVDCRFRPSRYQ